VHKLISVISLSELPVKTYNRLQSAGKQNNYSIRSRINVQCCQNLLPFKGNVNGKQKALVYGPVYSMSEEFKTEVSLSNCASNVLCRRTQQSPITFDLRLRKTRSGKSHDYHEAIVFRPPSQKTKTRRFEIPLVWWAFSKSSVRLDGLAWAEGRLNRRNKLRFQNFPTLCGRSHIFGLRKEKKMSYHSN